MAKAALQGGFYLKSLRASADETARGLSKRADALTGDRKALAKIRAEIADVGGKLSGETTYNELLLAGMRLGAIERELALLEFFGSKAD